MSGGERGREFIDQSSWKVVLGIEEQSDDRECSQQNGNWNQADILGLQNKRPIESLDGLGSFRFTTERFPPTL